MERPPVARDTICLNLWSYSPQLLLFFSFSYYEHGGGWNGVTVAEGEHRGRNNILAPNSRVIVHAPAWQNIAGAMLAIAAITRSHRARRRVE